MTSPATPGTDDVAPTTRVRTETARTMPLALGPIVGVLATAAFGWLAGGVLWAVVGVIAAALAATPPGSRISLAVVGLSVAASAVLTLTEGPLVARGDFADQRTWAARAMLLAVVTLTAHLTTRTGRGPGDGADAPRPADGP